MLSIDCKITTNNITKWIKQTMKKAGFTKLVIGVSGGVDSALTTALVTRAIGKENSYPVLLPYGDLHGNHSTDAMELIKNLEIQKEQISVIDISEAVDTVWSSINVIARNEVTKQTHKDQQTGLLHSSVNFRVRNDVASVRRGNIMARVRMIYLFDLAKKQNALVCGTENKTENYLGYFTRYGDSASDIEPIQGLYKTQVWEMAKYLQIPDAIISKAPTAGLWEEQTDEKELGFTYKDADMVLYYYFDQKLSIDKIIFKGITKETIKKVLQRVKRNQFKHKMPFTLS